MVLKSSHFPEDDLLPKRKEHVRLFDCLSLAVRQTDNASMKNSLASFLSSCAAFCLGEQGE
ncbi:hypothetical protein FQN60_006672 [Etheostoma spectabile]|uniref:Uncharacterized protein n=1 Tax=Etheostoma spectabile TaxID=54343 RepID=A0A5J5CGM6_9PERO|nr:hypothetical protein FQN60_006672 [Etheostoma spectabile]